MTREESAALLAYKQRSEKEQMSMDITSQFFTNYATYGEDAEKLNCLIINGLLKDGIIDEKEAIDLKSIEKKVKIAHGINFSDTSKLKARAAEAEKRIAERQKKIEQHLQEQEEIKKNQAAIKKRNEEAKKEQEEFYKKVNEARMNGTLSQLLGNDREVVNGTYSETTSTYKRLERHRRRQIKEMF